MNIAEQVINYVNLILRPPPRHLYVSIYYVYICMYGHAHSQVNHKIVKCAFVPQRRKYRQRNVIIM